MFSLVSGTKPCDVAAPTKLQGKNFGPFYGPVGCAPTSTKPIPVTPAKEFKIHSADVKHYQNPATPSTAENTPVTAEKPYAEVNSQPVAQKLPGKNLGPFYGPVGVAPTSTTPLPITGPKKFPIHPADLKKMEQRRINDEAAAAAQAAAAETSNNAPAATS